MTRALSLIAITLSVAAIAYTAWVHCTMQRRVESVVERELSAKEESLARSLADELESVYRNYGVADTPHDSKTVRELAGPLFDAVFRPSAKTRLLGMQPSPQR